MHVFRAAEEAGNMFDEAKRTHPGIPWRAIRGMRNIFAHDYGKLDRAVFRSAAADDFPTHKSFCLDYSESHNIELDYSS